MKKLIALNIVMIGINACFLVMYLNSTQYIPSLLSLGSLFENSQRYDYGDRFTFYGYLVEGEHISSIYPDKEISEMKSHISNGLSAWVWYDPKEISDDCYNSFVVITGIAVPYFGSAYGFDQISSMESMETGIRCIPEGREIEYFITVWLPELEAEELSQ